MDVRTSRLHAVRRQHALGEVLGVLGARGKVVTGRCGLYGRGGGGWGPGGARRRSLPLAVPGVLLFGVGGVPLQGALDGHGDGGHQVAAGAVPVLVGGVGELVGDAVVVRPRDLALDGLALVVGAQLLLYALLGAALAVTGLEAAARGGNEKDL